MRLARNLIIISVVLIVFGLVVGKPEALGLGGVVNFSPCDTPITYKLGSVDKRFGLSEQTFLQRTQDAALNWNNAVSKNVFMHDPQEGQVVVSLVYDERQSLKSKITNLDNKLEKDKAVFEQREADFERRSAAFKSRLEAYNSKVSEINARGGATPEEFDAIKQEEQELKKEADELNQLAKSLNKSADFFNSQVDQLNQTASTFSNTLEQKPEEGIYDPNTKTIEIFFYDNDPEFIHTLMHEFGHARGLGHLDNNKSIMYSFTSKSDKLTDDDINAMKQVCRTRNRFEYLGQEYVKRVRFLMDYYSGKVPNS